MLSTNIRGIAVSADTTVQNSRVRLRGWSFGLVDVASDIAFRNGTSVAAPILFTVAMGGGQRSDLMLGDGVVFTDGLFVDIPASCKGTVFFD